MYTILYALQYSSHNQFRLKNTFCEVEDHISTGMRCWFEVKIDSSEKLCMFTHALLGNVLADQSVNLDSLCL